MLDPDLLDLTRRLVSSAGRLDRRVATALTLNGIHSAADLRAKPWRSRGPEAGLHDLIMGTPKCGPKITEAVERMWRELRVAAR
jgi:hypothetical protein